MNKRKGFFIKANTNSPLLLNSICVLTYIYQGVDFTVTGRVIEKEDQYITIQTDQNMGITAPNLLENEILKDLKNYFYNSKEGISKGEFEYYFFYNSEKQRIEPNKVTRLDLLGC